MPIPIYFAAINGYRPDWAGGLPTRLEQCLPFPMHRLNIDFDLNLFYAPERNQYHSTLILAQLLKYLPTNEGKIIGITSVDLYIPVLTFVFGESQLGGSGAVVSTYRLRNEYYGLPRDNDLLLQRTVKEAMHELGHAFGLIHCRDYECVMNSSTYVEDIDLKQDKFCQVCQKELGVQCD